LTGKICKSKGKKWIGKQFCHCARAASEDGKVCLWVKLSAFAVQSTER